jgi:hypothetical protein
MNNMVTV